MAGSCRSHALSEGMFVGQVVGRSMEPGIPDGASCLVRSPVTGSRQGRIGVDEGDVSVIAELPEVLK